MRCQCLASNLPRWYVGKCGEYVVVKVRRSPASCVLFVSIFCCQHWAMNIIKIGAFCCILPGHEFYYSFVETSYGQLGIPSLYSALSNYSGQQSPHEYH